MLQALTVQDVVLIDRLELALSPGLNVLTGETGAGKSILLDALGLALGARGDAGLVRVGAAQATVVATFEVDVGHPALALLEGQGLTADRTLLLRRSLGADGRSRAAINDQPVTVGFLRSVAELLVEVHGQFEAQGLLDPKTHSAALDAFAGLEVEAASVARAWEGWTAAIVAEREAKTAAETAEREEAYLRHAEGELANLDPKPGEEAALAEERSLLSQREKLGQALETAQAELRAGRGVEGALHAALRQLERVAERLPGQSLDAVVEGLGRAAVEVAEAQSALDLLAHRLDADPAALERVEERLYALRAMARKHRVEVDGLAGLRDELSARLARLDDAGAVLQGLAAATAAAREGYVAAAAALEEKRRRAGLRLDRAMAREMKPLKLDKAQFRTAIETLPEAEWGPSGQSRVRFEVATNPGAAPGPIGRIASGGELARFMLALKVALAASGPAATLVFDEVDAGIGGAAAAAVGERLRRLSGEAQVLVVTHSPQVAARAHHHWRVTKVQGHERTLTRVAALSPAERQEEVARLLSGARVTDAARAAALSLIEGASP